MTGPVRIFCPLTYPCLPDTLPVPFPSSYFLFAYSIIENILT